ncbi:MAG: hypothetical protein K6E51_11415 [Treponema sp.]|nr:hypothetical protein [Treponema sp.]
MAKTFETNALKGKSFAAGMKRRIAELGKYGVKEADLTVMEQDADKAEAPRLSITGLSGCNHFYKYEFSEQRLF